MKMWIDPPSGWKYGFPMIYDNEADGPCDDFLRSKGYPEKDIEFAMSYMRCWNLSPEDVSEH